MPELAELEVWLKMRDEELQRGLADVDKRLDKFEKDSLRKINKAGEAMEGFGTSATRAGQALAPLSAIIAGIAGYSVKIAAEYQKMGNVFQAVSDASVAQMEAVRKKAVELGQDLKLPGTSAKDAMATMVELSRAGLSVAESMAAARGSIMLAAAGQLDNARAAEIQANAMNAFALKGQEAGRVADLFSEAANASSAGVEDLAQAFAMGSASAYQAGLRIEEYTATLAAMANAGIKGSDAGTAVKSMLISLTAPSDDAAKKMREIGLSYFDAAGKARPFLDVVGDLREDLAKMTQQQQADVMRKIFGTDGVRAAQIITRLGEGFNDLVGQMDGAKGSASNVAESMNNGLLGALDALRSSVETLLLAEGEKGLPALEKAIRSIAEQVSNLGKLPDPVKNLVVGLGAVGVAVGPALMAIGSMSTGMAAIAGAAASPVFAPLAASAVALAATLTTAFVAIKENWGGVGDEFNKVVSDVRVILGDLGREWKTFYVENRQILNDLAEAAKAAISVGVRGALVGLQNAIRPVALSLRLFKEGAVVAFDVARMTAQVLAEAWVTAGMRIQQIFHLVKAQGLAMASFIVGVVRTLGTALGPLGDVVGKAMGITGLHDKLRSWGAEAALQVQRLGREIKFASSAVASGAFYSNRGSRENGALAVVAAGSGGGNKTAPPDGNSNAGGSNGIGVGRREGGAKAPSEIARALSDDILIAVGRAVKSPGPSGMAACASFASTVLAYYTKGLTDEGGRIETSARSLVDKVIKQGGQVMEAAAARAGDLAFRKGQGPSGMHVGIVLGDGRIMDMNGQRDGKRNTMGLTTDKGWKAVGLPSGLIDRKFLLKESTSLGEAAGRAAVEAYLRPWESVVEKIKGRTQAVQAELRSMFLDERDKLAMESFGKLFKDLSSQGNKQVIEDLVKAQKELTEQQLTFSLRSRADQEIARWTEEMRSATDPTLMFAESLGYTAKEWAALTDAQKANYQWMALAKATGIGDPGLPESEVVKSNLNAKGDSAFGWAAREGKRIIEDINRSYEEYLENLAQEQRLLMANTEAERIRLEIVQQSRGWTEDMIQTATEKALKVDSIRRWRDQVQEIVGSLTDWIQGSLDALFERGFKGFFDQVYQGFVKMIADMAKQWLMSQLNKLLFNIVGSALGSPMKSNVGFNGGSTAAGSSVTARASGGPVMAGVPYLVGERGPELLVPGAAGHVYSHADTNRIVNAITQSQNSSSTQVSQPIIINITIQANDPAAFVASERQIEQAVAQAVRRGLRR